MNRACSSSRGWVTPCSKVCSRDLVCLVAGVVYLDNRDGPSQDLVSLPLLATSHRVRCSQASSNHLQWGLMECLSAQRVWRTLEMICRLMRRNLRKPRVKKAGRRLPRRTLQRKRRSLAHQGNQEQQLARAGVERRRTSLTLKVNWKGTWKAWDIHLEQAQHQVCHQICHLKDTQACSPHMACLDSLMSLDNQLYRIPQQAKLDPHFQLLALEALTHSQGLVHPLHPQQGQMVSIHLILMLMHHHIPVHQAFHMEPHIQWEGPKVQ